MITYILYIYSMLEHSQFVTIYIFMSHWCFSISTFKPAIFRAVFVSFSGSGNFGIAFCLAQPGTLFFLNYTLHISFVNDRESRRDRPNSGYLTTFSRAAYCSLFAVYISTPALLDLKIWNWCLPSLKYFCRWYLNIFIKELYHFSQ